MSNYPFRIIAIRVNSEKSIGKKKLIPYKYYYFYQGYEIDNEKIIVDKSQLVPIELYNGYLEKQGSQNPIISISAIVGQNGAGKSSIIEFAIRLINNFASTTIGEYKVNPSSDHLHYINNIYGELYYTIDGNYYKLKIEGRNVILESYSFIRENGAIEEYLKHDSSDIFNNKASNDEELQPFKQWREKGRMLKDYYKYFFYTFVSNYSVYAYNTLDFENECNTLEYEQKIRGSGKSTKYKVNERCWLNGIFHKNDGYQTPIVLSPFRNEGNINVNTENKLAKERLLSLMLKSDSSFRIINGHLEAYAFTLIKKKITYDASFLKNNIGFARLQARGYEKLEELITKLWSNALNIDITTFKGKRVFYTEAIGYLTYKTLKISSIHNQYDYFMNTHKGIHYKIDEKCLSDLVSELSKDSSHITKKIRQILIYIIYGIYDEGKIDINSVATKANDILIKQTKGHNPVFLWKIDDFVPPPIFDTTINLIDTNTKSHVIFETLSSGERQQAYSISSLLYHLTNLNSVNYDNNKKRVEYKCINIILEEIELYFHPELQINFIRYILDGIKQINLSNIEALNICVVTHSPFILSDVPTSNILLLDKYADTPDCSIVLKTLGANIYDMLKSSFFLTRGAIGEYVQWLINRLIISMNILILVKEDNIQVKEIEVKSSFIEEFISTEKKEEYVFLYRFIEDNKFNIADFKETYNADYLHKLIMLLDEPIIKNALLEEYHKIFSTVDKAKRILELKKQLKDLGENI